ncbi:MAG TPA: symmetrical bis(5'-nucleosyl)-tetraphosphatase, partial [Planctomycetota bacterium]|nr:symmetrical bis(5'-nucleosyl)-tetraphosphatase [Planctomycetota bacterium]
CFEPFLELLERANITFPKDRLWLVGDLVNRGPGSLEVLRWVREHQTDVTWVIGNHELHLLGTALGLRKPKDRDTLEPVIAAPDLPELLEMVRQAPLMHHEGRHVMVHAGLHPSWSLDGALGIAEEVAAALRSDDWKATLEQVYNAEVSGWKPKWQGAKRIRAALNYFTRARFLNKDGEVTENAGPPHRPEGKESPWYDWRPREEADAFTLIFGHWSTLGLHMDRGFIGLDTGCVYGRALTAVRLEDRAVFQVPGLRTPVGY